TDKPQVSAWRHHLQMADRERATYAARRLAERTLSDVGDELRRARVGCGLTQSAVGGSIGFSRGRVSRVELGRVRTLSIPEVISHAAVVGLRASIKLYPVGGAIHDAAQAKWIAKFVQRVGHAWRVRLEV